MNYIFAHEALVRGIHNEPASYIFEQINAKTRYQFDQACRVKAIQLAAELQIDCFLSINFMPNAIYDPALCLRTTLQAAEQYHFPINRILFEITEGEKVDDMSHLQKIIKYYKQAGFQLAIDDFGAGYSGLNLLADLNVDFIKLDRALIQNINLSFSRRAIVKGILQVCHDLGIQTIAEGVETQAEVIPFSGILFC